MQLWMERNVVTLHKVVETMAQQTCSVIKAKCGQCTLEKTFFLDGQHTLTKLYRLTSL